jgi:hypothetical protein
MIPPSSFQLPTPLEASETERKVPFGLVLAACALCRSQRPRQAGTDLSAAPFYCVFLDRRSPDPSAPVTYLIPASEIGAGSPDQCLLVLVKTR